MPPGKVPLPDIWRGPFDTVAEPIFSVVAPPGLTLPETVEEGNKMTILPWVVEPHMVIEVGPDPPPRVQLPDTLPPEVVREVTGGLTVAVSVKVADQLPWLPFEHCVVPPPLAGPE
jgi:hypothetical protein